MDDKDACPASLLLIVHGWTKMYLPMFHAGITTMQPHVAPHGPTTPTHHLCPTRVALAHRTTPCAHPLHSPTCRPPARLTTWPVCTKTYLQMFAARMGTRMPQVSLQTQLMSKPVHGHKAACGRGKGAADAVMAHAPDQGEEPHDEHGHQQHHPHASCMHGDMPSHTGMSAGTPNTSLAIPGCL